MSVVELDRVVVRLAGDSGDGMQLAGDRLTNASAILGNDLATLPDFPAEIRAPAGTLPGVSAFQLQFADHDVLTPGDTADALVAMNPAALRSQLRSLREGGVVIVNSDGFDQRALEKAGYRSNPLEDGTLSGFRVYQVPMTKLTLEAVSGLGAKPREAERAKNFFALGLVSWLYGRPLEPTVAWIQRRFAQADLIRETNLAALRAGWSYGETTEIFETTYRVKPAPLAPGTYTNITGNTALAWGLVAVSVLSGLPLFLGSYPITPASDLLHELARLKHFGVRTFQAEDEIAGIGAALGAAFGGCLGVTTTSGPGLDLKEETIGLAVALELPLVVVDVQRAGPSTGMPTKPEQSDLLAALYGRHGEAPVAVVAPQSPSDCFFAAIEAARIAIEYRTPVMLLSDAYLANGSEPWRLPDLDGLAPIEPRFASEPNGQDEEGRPVFHPYARDSETLARPWAPPGVSGLEHRIGGLEKADVSGNVSYDPENHERMVHLRAEKIARIRRVLPPAKLEGDPDAPVVVVGWGSTYGAISAAVARTRSLGHKVAHLHLRYLNPFPENLGGLLRGRKRVLVAELNLGQLCQLIRAEYLVDAKPISKVQGVPFLVAELEEALARACREVGA
jgi:2-oxoglutarate ferredoxin oxidoreductase subunit alpha